MARLFSRKPKTDPALEYFPDPFAELISYGKPADDMDYAAWAAQLAPYTTDLVRMVLDDDLNERDENDPAVWAPLHALKVLGVLGPVEAAEPLTECLDMEDEWFDEELPEAYAAIGPEAIPVLHAYLYDAAHESRARSIVSECLAAIAQRHAESYAEVVELLTAFLDRPEADDSAAEEEVTTSVIYDLSVMGARTAYDAIWRAYAQDRVTPRVIGLEDVEEDFGMRPPADSSRPSKKRRESGVSLELRCTVCGRERDHIFPVVYYDMGTGRDKKRSEKYDPLIIPQRVVCPKCGAVDQYELGGFGHIAVLASLMAETAERTGEKISDLPALPQDQRIRFLEFTTRWGPMHPLEATERYQRELARRPKDGSLLVGYGTVLRFLGRLEEAEELYRQALELDGDNLDAWESMAQLAGQRGDIPQAAYCWRRVLGLALTAPLSSGDRQETVDRARMSIEYLSRGEIPEFGPQMMGGPQPAKRSPAKPPAQRPAPGNATKVARNDPCPCGSGKKYKHCHGRPGASAE
jgi:tetratricopeptide (TPR) repeat protein